jgi:glycosyltransferase involved in cell wall biosynthesis
LCALLSRYESRIMKNAATSTPLVSVIVPTYNSAGFIRESLDSVLAQTFKDFEIIVVDDGSTDDTAKLLAAYRDSLRVIKKENGGPASARNAGIREARGELIAFQDADDLWTPDKLELQVACLAQHPEAALVHSDCIHFDGERTWGTHKERGYTVPTGMVFDRLLTDHFIGMPAVLARRACLEAVGLFDESLVGNEDYNLYLRLARKYPFQYVDKVLVRLRSHGQNLSDNLEVMRRDEIKNIEKITALFPDAVTRKRRLTGLVHLRFGKYYVGQKKFAPAKSCFLTALRHSPLLSEAWVWLALSVLPGRVRDSLFMINRLRRGAAAK